MKQQAFNKENRLELWKEPSIQSQFPVVFEQGQQWKQFTGYCGNCNQQIKTENLRGRVGSITKDIYLVKAVGYCEKCDLAICFLYHLHSDLSMTEPNGNCWKPQATIKTRIKRLYKKIVNHIKATFCNVQ